MAVKSSENESAHPGRKIPLQRRTPMIRFSILAKWPWAPLTVAPGNGGGASAASYGEDVLNSFAMAAVKVHRINSAYTRKMEVATSDPEKEELEQRANDEMEKAVENEGLTVDTYQDIASRLDTDPALAENVKHKIKKAV